MAHRGDARYSRKNLFSEQADWITFHTVVSTSPDQIAISPGYLQKEWTNGNRRYFEYSMGGTHVQDFAAWVSARYQVKKGNSTKASQSRSITTPRISTTSMT